MSVKDRNDRKKLLDKHLWIKLINSPEGKVLVIGLLLTLIYIVALGLYGLFSHKEFQVLVVMTATSILFGRAPCISFGYTMGLSHAAVISVTILTETILVLIIYPLFVFSWQHLLVIKPFNKLMKRIRKAAEKNRETLEKYGVIGLFVFVWIPFYMTGPVVGCVIGYLIGIQMWLNLVVVLLGTSIAIACWAVLLRNFHDFVVAFNPYMPFIMLITVIGIVVGIRLLYTQSYKNSFKKFEK